MTRWIAAALALAAAGSAAAAGPPPELKAICDLMCGFWLPETPDPDLQQPNFRLSWNEESGMLVGEMALGDPGDSTYAHGVSFALNPKTGAVAYVLDQPGLASASAKVEIVDGEVRAYGLVPGKPDLTAVAIFSFPAPGRMSELHALSGEQYNSAGDEFHYRRAPE